MSLNGLDNATVIEAHAAAAAEPGGWFLLRYASRDEIDLLNRGTGGIVELRKAISQFKEQSPLYGFLKYRRRNVIVKYEPEECSRLVKARAAVHFNAICERFSPYDATFEIAAAKDLKDTTLSAACQLHTASGSTSSSTSSLRRRRLMEITEEEEEEERERKRLSLSKEADESERPGTSADQDATSIPPEPQVVLDASSPTDAKFASTSEPPNFKGAMRPVSPAKSDLDYPLRLSSQSERPGLSSYSSYYYGKPKVRLAPRPSLDASKRPQTASNFRPVAALPQGFKFFSKKNKSQENAPETQGDSIAAATIIETNQETVESLLPPRPATSSGASMKSASLMTSSFQEKKLTPEKARLMKAMKLRQQKKKLSMILDQSPVAEVSSKKDEGVKTGAAASEEQESGDTLKVQSDDARSLSNADSGTVVDLPTSTDNNEGHNEDTATDSLPASPTAASSGIGESTKASSLSESTDETVLLTKEADHELVEEDGVKDRPVEADVLENRLATEESSSAVDEAEGTSVDDNVDNAPLAALPEITSVPKTAKHENANVSAQEASLAAEEPVLIPEKPGGPLAPIEPASIHESMPRKRSLEINSQDADPLARDGAVSPKSPYGIPMSRFSSNEQKSPTTPRLKSKFSTQDLKAAAEPILGFDPAPPSVPEKTDIESVKEEKEEPAVVSTPEKVARCHTSSLSTESSKPKRTIVSLTISQAAGTSQSEIVNPLVDNDAFMDELQAATVQEAVMVSKSPITPVFPNRSPSPKKALNGTKTSPLSRAVSNPMRGPLLAPADVASSSARSVSAGGAALLHDITRQSSSAGVQAKKTAGLGSSISQRIKALEQRNSLKPGEGKPDPLPRPKSTTPSSTFFTVRSSSIRDPPKSPVPDRNSIASKPAPEQSREESPEQPGEVRSRNRSGSVASRLSMFETPGAAPPMGRPESIQVTARIIRDPNQSFPKKPEVRKEPADVVTDELKESPLVVDHQKLETSPPRTPIPELKLAVVEPPMGTIQERRLSKDKKSLSEDGPEGKKRRPSLNIVKDFIKDRRASMSGKNSSADNLAVASPEPSSNKSPSRPPSVHQNNGTSIGRRLSISSRRSSFSKDHESSPMSPSALTEVGSGDDEKASEKKGKSRASRFMRRLSSSFSGSGGSRKNATPSISPTVAEENLDDMAAAASFAETRLDAANQPSISAYIGDVNVQFPDNLLWKRRSMCLDAQGFLFLNAVQGGAMNSRPKTGMRRYHLSDFQKPYIPDVEVQELPNSVVLDLIDGSGIQIACEDRAGQQHVLHVLLNAHKNHSSFGH